MLVYFYYTEVNINDEEFKYMLKNNYIKRTGDKYILTEQYDIKYLFSEKITFNKRLTYINKLNDSKFICSDCGQAHSYHIRPFISHDNKIDFDIIICVCKECRTKKLKKLDIIKPEFEKEIDWKKEKERINKEIKEKEIKNDKKYFAISSKIVKLKKFTKLVLPVIKNSEYTEEFKELNKLLGHDIDISISNVQNRELIKKFLWKESNKQCPVCGWKMRYWYETTIDHIIAKSLGGKNELKNFIGMCIDCNTEKDKKTVIEFLSTKKLKYVPNRILIEAYEQQKKAQEKLIKLENELKNVN